MISRKYFEYNFEDLKKEPWKRETFSVVFTAVSNELMGNVVSNGDGFSIFVRNADCSGHDAANARRNNYFFEKTNCLVLEASGIFSGECEPYVIGFPLYLAGAMDSAHEFAVTYDGVWFNIFCDGILFDRDSPDGGALESDAVPAISSDKVEAVISGSVCGIKRTEKTECADIPIYCYTPAGFNTWIGDVAVTSFNGVFHLFYLHDRHHHTSRKGRGAHVFCHLSSSNLTDWTDHGEVVNFDKPYLTIGTGNAFVFKDKLHLAFGWHTERSRPEEQCAAFLLKSDFAKSGKVDSVICDSLGDIYPSGASYAVSSNGFDFQYSRRIIHYVENPNITVMADGSLRLCEYGIWKGNDLDSWQIIDPDFPPRLRNSLSLNTTECPCFITIGEQEFLMIGFTGFYRREPDGKLTDLVAENLDFYDGMAVPMAAEYCNRIIAGAWMNTPDWGSFLMLRELILLDDGGVGSRWIPETLPAGEFVPVAIDSILTIPEIQINTLLSVKAEDTVTIRFSGDGNDCYLVVNPGTQSAAWLSAPEDKIEFFCDIARRRCDADSFRDLAGEPIHVWGENYARKIHLPEKNIDMRMIIHNEPKFHGTVIDVEINGKYTFVTYRRDLKRVLSVACK